MLLVDRSDCLVGVHSAVFRVAVRAVRSWRHSGRDPVTSDGEGTAAQLRDSASTYQRRQRWPKVASTRAASREGVYGRSEIEMRAAFWRARLRPRKLRQDDPDLILHAVASCSPR